MAPRSLTELLLAEANLFKEIKDPAALLGLRVEGLGFRVPAALRVLGVGLGGFWASTMFLFEWFYLEYRIGVGSLGYFLREAF